MAKVLVPADTLPVRGATALVAVMPVPASPSGGQNGMPGIRSPSSSKRRQPRFVKEPASSPATNTFGNTSRISHENPYGCKSAWKDDTIDSS